MLILTRKHGQKIFIGDSIVVTVTQIQPGQVRLGIDAPESVQIWREEIKHCIEHTERENARSDKT